jgi:Transglycosylase-like domain
LRVLTGRRSAVIVAVLATILVLTATGSAAFAAKSPPGLSRFMSAIARVESGGSYTSRNPRSGAYGKYQIMPSNWSAWARQYLGNANAKQTPANQEKVAAGKMTSLYRWLGSWKRVAYWWLTGSSRTTGWSSYAKRYVAKVMRYYRAGGGKDTAPKPASRWTASERSKSIAYTGTWRRAKHGGYGGDTVAYAKSAGASATFTFTGRKVTWNGPTGPTRGKAKVYVDGKYVKTVNTYGRSFDARSALFRTGWKTAGDHTITIVVVGTKGHPMIAIDDFVVVR